MWLGSDALYEIMERFLASVVIDAPLEIDGLRAKIVVDGI